ncbi:PadR family transcriptional regulator [Agrococcus sp. ARC_14]|uniref:PadR family transcriptional regulator n=1 Tax=Agrococcus sp. ARC_14 TaxID=2919927 RepID=UPI001F05B054|nr:PadR family transcriptional regulator [Agrococcus sp. ARC_14]MCH1882925.1 PadR family transcriptional regulator [Agrococcus sp. ARC_14]
MATASAAPQLRKGVLGPVVLALLEQRDRYGLEIVRELAALELIASEGTVYPLLTRLQDSRAVESTWVVSDSERPRRYYRLTAAGRDELAAFRADWPAFTRAVDSILDNHEG